MARSNAVEGQLRAALTHAADQVDTQTSERAILDAADTACPVTGSQRARAAGRRAWGPRLLMSAAAACVAVAAGVALWPEADEVSEASCADVLRWNGSDYVTFGELTRVPLPAEPLDGAVALGCDDGNGAVPDRPTQIWAIRGVDPTVGVLTGSGNVYVPAGTQQQDEGLRDLDTPVRCALPPDTTLQGTIVGVRTGSRVQNQVSPPFVATFQVTNPGTEFPFGPYQAVTLPLRVTVQTDGGADPRLITDAVQGGSPVEAVVSCAGPAFVASQVAVAD